MLLAFSGSLPAPPLPYRAAYAAAKAFQVTFTRALANELAGTGVQVQVCCPGLADRSVIDNVSRAQQALLLTAVSSPLASRYQPA